MNRKTKIRVLEELIAIREEINVVLENVLVLSVNAAALDKGLDRYQPLRMETK
jgi:hypothetical protein